MPYKEIIKTCGYCDTEYYTNDPRRKFCSHRCAGFGNNAQRGKKLTKTPEQIKKLSDSLKEKWRTNPECFVHGEKHSIAVGKGTKGKHKKHKITSLYEVSPRTKQKVLQRLKISCCVCGWNDCVCDLHHINGRKIENYNHHRNLAYVCPNCHRKIHIGLIKKEELTNLEAQIGDKWLELYYG